MDHDQHFTIVGFCDAAEKKHGHGDIIYFKNRDRYGAAHIPTQDELRQYAEEAGYYPSGKPGSVPGYCEPVYHVHGHGLEYVRCPECFKPSKAEGRLA